ncbi:MAG TPA: hypothetical protein VGC60_05825 [Pyrinomonadaceae bacterium]|jgi:hypothetical protein
MSNFGEKWKSATDNAKNTIGVFRDLMLVVLLILLILFPKVVNGLLLTAGFTKADIAGMHWESVQKASEQAGEAGQQIQAATQKIDAVQKDLDTLAAKSNDQAVKTEVNRLKTELNQSAQTTKNAGTDLQASLATQESVLQIARPQNAIGTGAWGAVISSDKDPQEAQFEVKKAQQLGYQNTHLYDRQNWFRTVVEFASVAEAQAALPTLRTKIRDTVYLVELAKWCPQKTDNGQGVLKCSGYQ